MKRMHRLLLCGVLLSFGYIHAQNPSLEMNRKKEAKPLLFASLPDSFAVDKTQLQKIFSAAINEQINLQLSSQFSIQGKIVDKNQHNPGSLSVNVRLSNYNNALLNLTLKLQADNSTSIHGRILHPRYSDILVLSKEKDGYLLKKTTQQLYMPE